MWRADTIIMIKVNPYREVVITRPCTVSFLTENAKNEMLLGAIDEMVSRFCQMTKQFMDEHAKSENSKKESNALLEYMQSFEKMLFNQMECERKEVVKKCVAVKKENVFECEWCHSGYRSKSWFTVHLKNCQLKPK